jgi:hypothetical protein
MNRASYDSTGGEMKRIRVALLWAALAFTGTGFAQNLPSQFVISGETARKIHDSTTINLATAERIAETCERLAQKEGVAISIYILDNDGTTFTCTAWTAKGISTSSPRR